MDKSLEKKATLVIGASENPSRYSYLAVNRLLQYQQPVFALGRKAGAINGVEILTGQPELEDIHTITLYINPFIQRSFYDYIIGLKPKRIIFNPGTENNELYSLARENGIEVVPACTLVMLNTGQY